jgi:hypothetical protein
MRVVLLACLALAAVAAPVNEPMLHKPQVSPAAKPVDRSLSATLTLECRNGLRDLAFCGDDDYDASCEGCMDQFIQALQQCNALNLEGSNGINAWIAAMDLNNPDHSWEMRMGRYEVTAALVMLDGCRPRK